MIKFFSFIAVFIIATSIGAFALEGTNYAASRTANVVLYKNHSASPSEEFSATFVKEIDGVGYWYTAASEVLGTNSFDSFYVSGHEASVYSILDGVAVLTTDDTLSLSDTVLGTTKVGDDLFYTDVPLTKKALTIRLQTEWFDGRIYSGWTFRSDVHPRHRDIGAGVFNENGELVGVLGAIDGDCNPPKCGTTNRVRIFSLGDFIEQN